VNANSVSSSGHVPVLLRQVIDGLDVRPDGRYIDGTFGRGGHSREILRLLGDDGRLLAIDRDPEAVEFGCDSFGSDPRFEIVKGEIADIMDIAAERDLLGAADGLLLDLGVSSPQLDEPGRGFSFSNDGPLDMRMDPGKGDSAADWINVAEEKELKRVLFEYGEEKEAARIARAIVAARARQPIERTSQLAEVVSAATTGRAQRIHPALEDRIVKRFMRSASRVAEPYRGLPDIPDEFRPHFRLIGGVIKADEREQATNPRSRSVRLRIAERL
jgi:16S rRNA (cytosine1402-N4)-methyltransferase